MARAELYEIEPRPSPRQPVVLAALEVPETDWEESLDELERLADTANGQVVGQLTQRRESPDPSTYFGKGKVEEIRQVVERTNASLLVIDGEISPSQQRNLEKILDIQVIDRTGLILDIFARRAHTAEGKLQVELAQLEYLLPRLANMWSHLERIRGGIGLRGPGETQIETDRRLVRNRIAQLKRKVEEIRHRRAVQRSQRAQSQIPLISLVGYTNAGKSTLLNTISEAEVFVEDKLFATLDPTTRDVIFPNGTRALVSDTVGFIRNLPTQLVAAFRSTLEEVLSADILVHVVDASNPGWVEQAETVDQVLAELGAADKPVIMAFNKMDQVEDPLLLKRLATRYPYAVFLTARKGEGMEELEQEIITVLRSRWQDIHVRLPLSASQLVAEMHARGEIALEDYAEDSVELVGRAPADLAARIMRHAI
ncbi:MAG TPA: GTPase HflX [Armatimonadota bacterium]|nr:GTPase HflX [Armatimonadota bacterium]